MKELTYTIYSISCPETGDIRYIGCTCVPLRMRLDGHLYKTSSSVKVKEWINSLGKKPIIKPIELVSSDERISRETYWISFYANKGFNLLNIVNMPKKLKKYKCAYCQKEFFEDSKKNRVYCSNGCKNKGISS